MRKTINSKNEIGTSLVELLLYIGLLSIVLFVVVNLLFTTLGLKQESDSSSSLQQEEGFLTQRLTYEVQNADSIVSPSGLGNGGTTLVLTNGAETHTFSVVNGGLVYQKTVGTTTTAANLNSNLTSVSNFSVQNMGFLGGKISVEITFTLNTLKATQQGTKSKDFDLVATLR